MQKHAHYLISSTELPWPVHFPAKKTHIPYLSKIEVEKIHSIWLSSAGTHQREGDVEGWKGWQQGPAVG